jgi:actin-related protein
MKISDILRVIANNMDHPEGGAPDPRIQNPAGLIDVTVQTSDEISNDSEDKTASGNDKSPEDLFLPPLQQKQELLKKAVGVENVYDDGTPAEKYEDEKAEEEQNEDGKEDILARIKQLGGVPMAAIQELSNDEPLDD